MFKKNNIRSISIKNFVITTKGNQYTLTPVTAMAVSLAAHCRYHGHELAYPTWEGVLEAAMHMDAAILARKDVPWGHFTR